MSSDQGGSDLLDVRLCGFTADFVGGAGSPPGPTPAIRSSAILRRVHRMGPEEADVPGRAVPWPVRRKAFTERIVKVLDKSGS